MRLGHEPYPPNQSSPRKNIPCTAPATQPSRIAIHAAYRLIVTTGPVSRFTPLYLPEKGEALGHKDEHNQIYYSKEANEDHMRYLADR